MNQRSPWIATGVALATGIVCVLGVRAELARAHLTETQASAHFATAHTADLACGADPANGC
ncbi:MAG: hypothetical protein WA803_03110 [Steroidobacteraceae bacterium]